MLPPSGGAPRTVGLHVSGIIRCIATETGFLKPEWVEELSLVDASQVDWWNGLDESSQLRVALGLAWEQWYIPQLGNVVDHPGEMVLNGVYLTHDGESLDMVLSSSGKWELAVHEVKATYKSIRTVAPRLVDGVGDADLSSQFMWLSQTMAYAKARGARVVYLHVLFMCGDYSFPIKPRRLVWRIDYTQEELDENWDTLLLYVRERRHLLPLDFDFDGME